MISPTLSAAYLLLSRRACNRFDTLLTASLVTFVVLVCLKLLYSMVTDFAGTVRSSGSPVAVVKRLVAFLTIVEYTVCTHTYIYGTCAYRRSSSVAGLTGDLTNQRVEHAQASLLVSIGHCATGHKFQGAKVVNTVFMQYCFAAATCIEMAASSIFLVSALARIK